LPLKAIRPRRLYRQIADQLRDLINAGEFPVGTRLPAERELAESLGVSRPSVREALIALEVEGLIRIDVGSGISVIGRSTQSSIRLDEGNPPEGPFETLRAREIVEAAIAAEAAMAAQPEHIAELDRVLNGMVRCRGPKEELVALDREFHVTVAAILENEVLAHLVGRLFDQRMNPYFEHLANYFENASTWRQALDEHRVVRDAIAAGDPRGAHGAMRRHLRRSQDRFSRSFGEPDRPPFATGGNKPVSRKQAARPQASPSNTNQRKQP
jgi:DNA-binding FadR family transcriptional regulator